MTIIAIRTHNISAEKIASISYQSGKLVVDCAEGASFEFDDMAGDLYSTAMKQWREYLENRQGHWQEAIQYGIILASERGALSA